MKWIQDETEKDRRKAGASGRESERDRESQRGRGKKTAKGRKKEREETASKPAEMTNRTTPGEGANANFGSAKPKSPNPKKNTQETLKPQATKTSARGLNGRSPLAGRFPKNHKL